MNEGLSDAHQCRDSAKKGIDRWFSIVLSKKKKKEFVNYIPYFDG